MEATVHFNRFQETIELVEELTSRAAVIAEEQAIEAAKQQECYTFRKWWQFWKPTIVETRLLYDKLTEDPTPATNRCGDELGYNYDFEYYLKYSDRYDFRLDFPQEMIDSIRRYRRATTLNTRLIQELEAATMIKAGSVTFSSEELRWLAIFEELIQEVSQQ